MKLADLAVLSLACFRLSHLLSNDSGNDLGPWEILSKIRQLIGVRYDERSNPYGTNELAKGALCMWCNSIWFGTLISVIYVILGKKAVFIFLPFALSGMVVLIKLFSER